MSTHYDRTRATVRITSDEPTRASAWSSSRLGDPEIAMSHRSEPDDYGFDQSPSASKPRSTSKIAWAAAAAVGTIGAGILVGAVLFGGAGSSQPPPTGVVPGASVRTVSPNAPAAVPPAAVPAPDPGQAAPDPGQAQAGAPATDGGAPAATDGGAPAAGGGSAPAATDPADGGSAPAPQAGGPAAAPGYAPGVPYGPGIVIAPNLNMPGGGGQPGPGGGGAQSGGGAQNGGGGGSTAITTVPPVNGSSIPGLPPGSTHHIQAPPAFQNHNGSTGSSSVPSPGSTHHVQAPPGVNFPHP
jgi:hypothetical protein